MKDIQSLNVEKKIQQPIKGRQFSRYKNMNSTSNKLLHNKCFNRKRTYKFTTFQ